MNLQQVAQATRMVIDAALKQGGLAMQDATIILRNFIEEQLKEMASGKEDETEKEGSLDDS